ncbi:Methylated-DNA--protein-cysteine methyltransferase [Ephemeroptericola cinctiostellae]|uniref:Methylated-DNA--protein-cysteine methyltransferase n=1 Tax=Ephemeroptericola cinctiostellae TaxID=2268024 RepID=A0A345D7I7_9BURK|nr:methylated-DNA--[protein]-cysteine S-methyltransferase [Ephemeroptericola cinctiostellae]AXF84325.1 Methylated-DNA--protein-cysteine methyltransferase [Ephemeroptericola cinctiostellae]
MSLSSAQKISPDWFDAIVSAPFGGVGVRLSENKAHVSELLYLPTDGFDKLGESELSVRAHIQITAYLKNASSDFDLPLLDQGTEFQKRVWQVVSLIECGQVLSYKQVGQIIRCGSPRAVGGACGANPYPLITPCHRVVAAQSIGGFARHDNGFHVAVKQWLLAHEGIVY